MALSTALGVIRMCVGAVSLLSPRVAYRSLGVHANPSDGGTGVRMFGVRDAAIAMATLSNDPKVRRTGLQLGALADTVDVGAVLLGRRSGSVSRPGLALIGGAAALFAVMGAAVLGSDRG
ncbi:hypothetical protein A5781_03435 [Mycobacterium sp. 852002-30065_SCH5024008]|nr:hypothetical protein A5781_03435 [Mycobacterium sp. 852002-30065_SCH5024008]